MINRGWCDHLLGPGGKDLAAGSVGEHMRSQHDMEPVPLGHAPTHAPVGYQVTRPHCRGAWHCPAPECQYKAGSQNLLSRHFATRHPGDVFRVKSERFIATCARCGMQVSPTGWASGHLTSKLCQMLSQEREQARAIRRNLEAQSAEFSALGTALGTVHDFCYLGRILAECDSDHPALRRNLAKARQRWAQVSRILVREGATPRVSGRFHKAIVQSVLLFGSETWVWTESMRQTLRGFHNRVARRLTNKSARLLNGEWVLPPVQEALDAAGLLPLDAYVDRRLVAMLAKVHSRPIYQICVATPRLPSTPHTKVLWWEQFDR